jgi:hypothetical protein
MPRKKSTERQIIKAVTAIRRRNNILWMVLFRIAMKDPSAKKVIREIASNDRKIVKWMSRI